MKNIITVIILLFSIVIFGQNTSSKKFQRKFKKLNTINQVDAFITSEDYIETSEVTNITEIQGIKVNIKTYYNIDEKEKLYIIICEEFKDDFFFVGGIINEVLDKDKQVALDFSFKHEYYSYFNNDNYFSYLIKDNER